jgi:hypothetical protein
MRGERGVLDGAFFGLKDVCQVFEIILGGV